MWLVGVRKFHFPQFAEVTRQPIFQHATRAAGSDQQQIM